MASSQLVKLANQAFPSMSLNHLPSVSAMSPMPTEEKQVPSFTDDQYTPQHQFKIFVGIDFGTDGSGLAYALQDGQTYIHNLWRDVKSTEKPKTSVLFDNHGSVQCHGDQAVIQYISSMSNKGWKLFERFKMKLYEDPIWKTDVRSTKRSLNRTVDLKEEIKSTNNNEISEPSEIVFVAQLKFLKNEAMIFINRNFKRKKRLKFNADDIQWILTVPAIWSDKAKQRMKDWAVKAELIQNHIPNQLKIVYEPDCASLSIQHALIRNLEPKVTDDDEKLSLTDMSSINSQNVKRKITLREHRPTINIDVPFKKGDKYILLDVGGGTCDVACHEIMGEWAIAETLHPSGGPWGACNIDKEFEMMLHDIFSREWMNEFKEHWPSMYQQLLQNFIKDSKISFYEKAVRCDYHDVTLPCSFGDFLIEKLEDGNDEHEHDDLLDVYLKNRCNELYKQEDLMYISEVAEVSIGTSYLLSVHFDLWKKLFNIVVDPIIDHIEKILSNKCMKQCRYIFLVGGFSNAKYLQERIKYQFGDRIQIVIPQLPQLCVVDGAARYGLQPNFMKIRRLAKSYGIQTNKSLKSLKNQNALHLFPPGFVKQHKYFDKELNQEYVKQCFCLFGVKNKAIKIDKAIIKKAVYKMTKEQKKMMIEIFQSNKPKPMTTFPLEGSKKIGKLIIDLPDTDEYKVWVEFKWSDTMLVVESYPNNRRDLKRQSIVQYH